MRPPSPLRLSTATATTTSTVISVSGWPRCSPAGDNRLNLFHFMPQAPKYNPCETPPGLAAPLYLPFRPPPRVESWQQLPQSTGLSCEDGGLQDYRPSEEITVSVHVWVLSVYVTVLVYVRIIGLCQLRWSVCCI